MQISIRFDFDHELVLSTYAGTLCVGGIRRSRDVIHAHPRFSPELRRLVDARAITDIALTSRELQMLGQQSLHATGAARAFLVGSDGTYAVARVASAWYESNWPNTRIFRDEAELLAWLGLPADYFAALPAIDHELEVAVA